MASRNLDLRITSDAGRFASAMARADAALARVGAAATRSSSQLDGLDRRFRSVQGAANTARAALAGYLSIATIQRVGRFTGQLVQQSTALVEQARAFGVASDELEVFQRVLRGDGATLQQVNAGLGQFTRRIGLAAQGLGEGRRVFEQYGIALRDSAGNIRGTLDVYRDLVRAIEGVDPAARAAALGLAIGEEAARTFAASAARGADSLDRAFNRERSFGVATDEQNESLKALDDTMRQVLDAVQTLGRVVLAEFAPAIDRMLARVREGIAVLIDMEQRTGNISDAINEFLERIRVFLSTTARSVQVIGQAIFSLTLFGRAWRILRGVVEGVRRVLSPVLNLLLRFLGAAGVFGALQDVQRAFRELFEPLQALLRPLQDADGAASSLDEALNSLSGSMERLRREAPELAPQFAQEFERINRLANAIERGFEALQLPPTSRPGAFVFATEAGLDAARERVLAAARRLNQQLIEALFQAPPAAAAERLVEQIGQRLTLAGAQRQLQRIYERVFPPDFETMLDIGFDERITTRLDGTRVVLEDVNEQLEQTSLLAAAAGASIADAFSDALLQVQSVGDALRAVGELILRSGIQQFIGQPLSNLFAGFFARGGSIPAGQFGVAGEGGQPELVFGPATVVPFDDVGAAAININVTVEGDPNPEFTAAAAENAARAAVVEALGSRTLRNAGRGR